MMVPQRPSVSGDVRKKRARSRRFVTGVAGAASLFATVAVACFGTTDEGGFEPVAEAAPADAGALIQGPIAPPAIEDIVQACALLVANTCDHPVGSGVTHPLPIPTQYIPAGFAACVDKLSEELLSPATVTLTTLLTDCAVNATSCARLRSCALRSADEAACAGRGPVDQVGFCDKDGRALACWHGHILAVRDCPSESENCLVLSSDGGPNQPQSQAMCVLGTCAQAGMQPGSAKCGGAGGQSTHVLRCESGKVTAINCEQRGLRCSPNGGPNGEAACATTLPACSAGARRCEGNVAVGCQNGHEVKIDCGRAGKGFSCAGGANAVAVGSCFFTPPSTGACNPNDAPSCDRNGTDLKFCFKGEPRTHNCAAMSKRCVNDRTAGAHCG